MKFSDRLKEKRLEAQLSQNDLAKKAGVGSRTICNYETGARMPNSLSIVTKLAEALSTTSTYLLGEDGMMVVEASEKYGARGAKQAKALLSEVTGLFAGGEMSEGDMDEMMKAIQDAYWDAKERNKKYTPKKYRK